jgi:hypothetical protein
MFPKGSKSPDKPTKRLLRVQNELRVALDEAPHVRQLLEEWIELRSRQRPRSMYAKSRE